MSLSLEQRRERFLLKMKEIYPDQHSAVIEAINQVLPTTFRVNTLRAKPGDVLTELKELGFVIASGPFGNSYIVREAPETQRLSDTKSFQQGLIYIQSLASMLPALVLDPQGDERILDLCAAPGSKTTQIITLTEGRAPVVAVEKNWKRARLLQQIVEQYPATDVRVVTGSGTAVGYLLPEAAGSFDKVLVDVPCTNEVYLNPSVIETFAEWNPKNARNLSKLQRRLLQSGARMLKPGGRLVYSTCTFSVEENELVVDWVLRQESALELCSIALPVDNWLPGITEWQGKKCDPSLGNTRRILPDNDFSGFYVALFEKTS